MDQAQWKAISAIFDAAIELPSADRGGFVRSASNGDKLVVSEVLAMLEADGALYNGPEKSAFLKPLVFPGDAFELFPPCPPPFQVDELVRERFRIVRAVGEGGMGHVFEAWDEELEIRVALKAIRSEISTHPESLGRFRREVRVGLQANHPNICRTFQIDREARLAPGTGAVQSIYFFTMEFLDGETLAALLSRGPVDIEDALTYARQVAAALDCAHDLGVVHRDIKPANIMLVPVSAATGSSASSRRAVVTDFGLAHLDPLLAEGDAPVLSRSGFAAGTLAYMAPEQLNGGMVSPATDVYAFGLLLFEMTTGQRAVIPGVRRPSPRALAPDLPPQWERAIERCLDPRPAERFQRASDVVAALTAESSPTLRPRERTSAKRSALTGASKPGFGQAVARKPAVAIVFVLLFVSLLTAAFRLYLQREASSRVGAGALVYFAPVDNKTGDKALDNLTELIQSGLTQSAHINLLDRKRVGDILEQMAKAPEAAIDPPTGREVALRAGAQRVAFATVTGSAGEYRLDMDIEEPDASALSRYRHRWTHSWTWESREVAEQPTAIPPQLLTTVRDASDWVRQQVGESANDIAQLDAPPEDVTTSSWLALEDYTQAQRLSHEGQLASAVLLLKDAVKQDPQFALAYGSMGDLLLSLNRDLEGYRAYDKALSLGLQNRLTRKEEDRIRGMRAEDTRDYDLAVDAFHDYTIYYRDDYIGWAYSTEPLRMLGRDEEVIANLRKASELAPEKPFPLFTIAQELLLLNRRQEAMQWAARLERRGQADLAAKVNAEAAFLDHRYDQVAVILGPLSKSNDPRRRSDSYSWQASLAAEKGHYGEALDYLAQGRIEDESQNDVEQEATHLLDRAWLEYKTRDFAACLKDVRAGFALSPMPKNALRADTVLGNAFAVAPAGFDPEIRGALKSVQRSLPAEDYGNIAKVVKLSTLGEIELANGRPDAALKAFKSAAAKDAPAGAREYLGRALVAAAAVEHDKRAEEGLLKQALAAYSAIALRPAFVWADPVSFPPGFYADELGAYLKVAERLHLRSTDVQQASAEYMQLRRQ